MRRILFFTLPAVSLLVVVCLFLFNPLGGGERLSEPDDAVLQQMSGHFDATADISYRGIAATATISQQSPEACAVTFTQPDSLKDMTFIFSRDNVEVGYRGLSFAFDPASMPSGAMARLTVSALNAATQGDDLQLTRTNEGLAVTGQIDQGAFTLLLDEETGTPLKLSLPGHSMELDFTSFTFLG